MFPNAPAQDTSMICFNCNFFQTESPEAVFLPAEGAAEKEHSSSLAIFFVLFVLILCIFLIHFLLQNKFHYLPESLGEQRIYLLSRWDLDSAQSHKLCFLSYRFSRRNHWTRHSPLAFDGAKERGIFFSYHVFSRSFTADHIRVRVQLAQRLDFAWRKNDLFTLC